MLSLWGDRALLRRFRTLIAQPSIWWVIEPAERREVRER